MYQYRNKKISAPVVADTDYDSDRYDHKHKTRYILQQFFSGKYCQSRAYRTDGEYCQIICHKQKNTN
jgi:hypothetical protein